MKQEKLEAIKDTYSFLKLKEAIVATKKICKHSDVPLSEVLAEAVRCCSWHSGCEDKVMDCESCKHPANFNCYPCNVCKVPYSHWENAESV